MRIRTNTPVRRADHPNAGKGDERYPPVPPVIDATQRLTPGDGDLFTVPAVASYLAEGTEDVTAAVYDDVTGLHIHLPTGRRPGPPPVS